MDQSPTNLNLLWTDRLILRKPAPSDVEQIERLLNDKEIASNTRSIDYPYPKGGAIKWIESQNKLRACGDAYVFSICEKAAQQNNENENGLANQLKMIGAIGFEINKTDENAELGYWIGREYWNRGYCTEACRRVIEFGFETLGLQKICSHHLKRNPASGRVLEKVGMTFEGLRRKHVRKWGVFEDVAFYGILAGDQRT